MTIQENVPLAPLTTLQVGGAARYFAELRREDDVREAAQFAKSRDLPLFVLGGGSNLVVADSGWPGMLSTESPRRAITSTTRSGGTPRVASTPAGSRTRLSLVGLRMLTSALTSCIMSLSEETTKTRWPDRKSVGEGK